MCSLLWDKQRRCYPSDPHDQDLPLELIDSGFCNEFGQMEQGTPGLEANPGREFLYGAWSQLYHETGESDAMARRVWRIDDVIGSDAWVFGQGPNN